MNLARSVLAVRHCESSGPAPDAPLTALGQAQAERLAEARSCQGVSRIVSSPYLRARETAAPLAKRLGLAVAIDARLAERALSPQPIDHWRDVVARTFVDLDYRVTGGESGREALARGWTALVDSLAHPGTLIVSHGQLLSLVLQRIDPSFRFAGWQAMTIPDLFRIDATNDAIRFERVPL